MNEPLRKDTLPSEENAAATTGSWLKRSVG
jgi:hypothetical protein